MRWNYSYLKLEISQYNANKYGTRKNIQWFSTFGLRHSDMAFGCPNDYACVFCAVPTIHCNVWDHPTHLEIALPKMSLGPLWINSVSRNLASIHVARGLAPEINDRGESSYCCEKHRKRIMKNKPTTSYNYIYKFTDTLPPLRGRV